MYTVRGTSRTSLCSRRLTFPHPPLSMDPAANSAGSESGKAKHFAFSSTVPACMRESVEALFFFNPRQALLSAAIYDTIQRTGVPRLMELEDTVWIGVPSGALQCLFASDCSSEAHRVAGVALYGRPAPDALSVVHLAVNSAYAGAGEAGGTGVGQVLIKKIKEIGSRVQGITRIQLPYRHQAFLRVYTPFLPGV